jgi:hypothetical protein
MRGGVCCHRGLSAPSVSSSGARDGVVLENAHAEVRTRDGFEGAARSGDEAAEKRQRRGLLEAIEAVRGRCGRVQVRCGVGVKAPLAG